MSKIVVVAAAAAGYVMGTRAGREQYVQIKAKAEQVWGDPRVQEKTAQATGLVKSKASQAKEQVSGQGSDSSPDPAKHATGTGAAGTRGVPVTGSLDDAPPVVNPPRGSGL